MELTLLGLAAVIFGAAAVASWINATLFKLPIAVALLVLGMLASVMVMALDQLQPQLGAGRMFTAVVGQVDYPKLILRFMLAYLLFAGAMNVDVGALGRRSLAAGVLATLGVVISAGVIGVCFWGIAGALGYDMPLTWAVVFGVIVSPTDPIAVLATVKRTTLERLLRSQIEGEALFNDGVAVVLFRAALAFALAHGAGHVDTLQIGGRVLIEALGGAGIGLAFSVVAVGFMRVVDDWGAETLITIAVATGVYAVALALEVSGPIGVVCAGLVMGSRWSEKGMSDNTRRYLNPFWHLVDENMNGIMFFLMGLQLYGLHFEPRYALVALAVVPVGLAARWISVALPSAALLATGRTVSLGLLSLLTWAGVRGGLSAAMALSLPDTPQKPVILIATFSVAVFSIVVQSMTVEGLVVRTGYGQRRADPEPSY